jgi:hypothetical protein
MSKQDSKLVASKQRYEIAYIAKKFKVTQAIVRDAALRASKTDKPTRSRKKIEQELFSMGYTVAVTPLKLKSLNLELKEKLASVIPD